MQQNFSNHENCLELLAHITADELIFLLAQAKTGHPFPPYEAVPPQVVEKARDVLQAYINALDQFGAAHPMD